MLSLPFTPIFLWNEFGAFNPGPALIFILPLVIFGIVKIFLTRGKRRISWIMLCGFAGAYYLMWFFGYQSNRFLVPFFGLQMVIAGRLIAGLRKNNRIAAAALGIGMFACFAYGSLWSSRWILAESQPFPLPVFLGMEHREEYLERALDYYPAINAVNDIVPPGEKVLCVGEHRAYYFQPELIISDWFDAPAILDLIRETENNDELFQRLKKRDCTYVFYNKGELSKYFNAFFKPRFSEYELYRYLDFMSSDNLELQSPIGDVMIYHIRFE